MRKVAQLTRPMSGTRAKQVADAMYRRIQDGEWQVGAKLPSVSALAAQLDVGVSSVREAIQQLSARGLLQSRRGSGVYLIATDDVADRRLSDHFADSISVLEVRLALEVEAAELAARRRTDEDLADLRRCLRELTDARRADLDRYVSAEIAFHRAVVQAAHNPILLWLFDEFAPILAQTISSSRHGYGPKQYAEQNDPHVHMVRLIADRDSAKASRTIRSHLEALILAQEQGSRTGDLSSSSVGDQPAA